MSSTIHRGHEFDDVLKAYVFKKEFVRRDLQEFEEFIFLQHQELACMIPFQKADLNKKSRKLTKAIYEHRDYLHRQIDTVVVNMELDLKEMNSKYLTILHKQEAEIELNILEIKRCMANLKKLLDSNDISLVSAYKSGYAEFRKLPPKVKVIFPQFTSYKMNRDWIYQQFGSLLALHFLTEERIYRKQILVVGSSSPDRPLIDEPFTVKTIPTEIDDLTSVVYLEYEKIWTSGQGNIMMLYNLHGELVRSIQTKSGIELAKRYNSGEEWGSSLC